MNLARSLELLVNLLHNRGPNSRLLARNRLSHSQFLQLRFLLWNPNCTIGELADKLGISRPAATQGIDRLVGRGLVRRIGDADDRRRVQLRLTPRGEALTRRTVVDMQRGLDSVLSKMDSDDREALVRGVDAFLVHALDDVNMLDDVCLGCIHDGDEQCPVNIASLRLTGRPVRCLLPVEAGGRRNRVAAGG